MRNKNAQGLIAARAPKVFDNRLLTLTTTMLPMGSKK